MSIANLDYDLGEDQKSHVEGSEWGRKIVLAGGGGGGGGVGGTRGGGQRGWD